MIASFTESTKSRTSIANYEKFVKNALFPSSEAKIHAKSTSRNKSTVRYRLREMTAEGQKENLNASYTTHKSAKLTNETLAKNLCDTIQSGDLLNEIIAILANNTVGFKLN